MHLGSQGDLNWMKLNRISMQWKPLNSIEYVDLLENLDSQNEPRSKKDLKVVELRKSSGVSNRGSRLICGNGKLGRGRKAGRGENGGLPNTFQLLSSAQCVTRTLVGLWCKYDFPISNDAINKHSLGIAFEVKVMLSPQWDANIRS